MHFDFGTVLVLTTVLASFVLLFQGSERTFPTIAVIASGLQALMIFGVLTLTLTKFRVDVILPALLVIAGAVCWARTSTKGGITAATVVAFSGAAQLFLVLR
jgi:hypothetical protein